ncbi:conjugal transfer protein TraE [Yersinia enterocolitica]|nr:conjugal transfer protein TraE [Yersinia enterocolitica]EKN6008219.1 conjugal transfer protein TraE [Yersinia enterocolitica]ELW7373693.1 conjugal transfer protein TraE [Yersinia enterocolitica]ELW9028237.1 conjugal transfer protein TraE [Yersinia enterocolitica]ELY5238170.1 conjugal transfer protein TraE [Yersinia enterocolitica]
MSVFQADPSLIKIIQSLIATGNSRAKEQNVGMEDGPKEITSIRLKPQTRTYLQAQSEALGISVSQLINIMVDGVVEMETAPINNLIDSLYDRLMLVFESHHITPLDMSRMLSKYGVTLSKIKSRDSMLDIITPEMLKEVSDWFGVNSGWLSGEKADIHPRNCVHWDKHPDNMILSVIDRLIKHRKIDVYVIKTDGVSFEAAENHDDATHNMRMGFLIKYQHTVEGVTFDKYELCEFQRWNYVRCRNELKAIFLGIMKLEELYTGVHLHGYSLDMKVMDKLIQGEVFPSILEDVIRRNGTWYPEDHVTGVCLTPQIEKYIEAYTGLPSKHFVEEESDDHFSIKWTISVFGNDQKIYQYRYLNDALNDIYDKYHKNCNDKQS